MSTLTDYAREQIALYLRGKGPFPEWLQPADGFYLVTTDSIVVTALPPDESGVRGVRVELAHGRHALLGVEHRLKDTDHMRIAEVLSSVPITIETAH